MNSTQQSEDSRLDSSYRKKLARLVTMLLIVTSCAMLVDIFLALLK